MRRAAVGAMMMMMAFSCPASEPSARTVAGANGVQFHPLDVVLDAKVPIAAYQVEITVRSGDSSIVGVEGGESPFDAPPYYDPAALSRGRIILAAFDTRATIPAGRHRVATLHVREVGPAAEYDIKLTVAADIDGTRCPGRVSLEAREGNQ